MHPGKEEEIEELIKISTTKEDSGPGNIQNTRVSSKRIGNKNGEKPIGRDEKSIKR